MLMLVVVMLLPITLVAPTAAAVATALLPTMGSARLLRGGGRGCPTFLLPNPRAFDGCHNAARHISKRAFIVAAREKEGKGASFCYVRSSSFQRSFNHDFVPS